VTRYNSIWDGPGRNFRKDSDGDYVFTDKDYIVIHNTSNDASDANEASYAKRRTDGVSSHYYVDRDSIRQSGDTRWRAQHVGSAEGNNRGISYEITGSNAKSRSWWIDNVAWSKLASQIRMDCDVHDIASRLLSVAQIREGRLTGIITHNQARLAWGYTTHTDPGPNFPMDYLLEKVTGAKPSTPPAQQPPTGGNDWAEEIAMAMPTLKQGSSGRNVGRLQSLLAANGFPPRASFNSKGEPDENFGDGTGDALEAFQEARKVRNSVVNGKGDRIAGRWTWHFLLGQD
jgi:N-acetyl-anhydromuramyl-L-alanine amidase AmpD